MRGLYASTREAEMTHFPFDEAQKRAFLDQQFAAQFAHYGLHYPTCERNIIVRDGVPVGRLWIDEWRDQIRLVDVALVPECRGAGIGSTLLRQVMNRGAVAGKPVTIHVEGFNPALRLYERLGFEHVDTDAVAFLLLPSSELSNPAPPSRSLARGLHDSRRCRRRQLLADLRNRGNLNRPPTGQWAVGARADFCFASATRRR